MPQLQQLPLCHLQCSYHPIDVRCPGVSDDQNFHSECRFACLNALVENHDQHDDHNDENPKDAQQLI